MLVLGLLAMVTVWMLAPYIVPILFGEGYDDSVELLYILSTTLPILFLASNIGSVLLVKDNMRLKVKLMGLTAVVNIILNLILIPLYGMVGAAIATVVSNIFLLALYWYFGRRIMKIYMNLTPNS
jgi:O-antigen/teichoic acid export membrane protein